MLQMTNKSIEEEAEAFVSEEKEVASVANIIAGADIAEHDSCEKADYRITLRGPYCKERNHQFCGKGSGDTVCLRNVLRI